MGASVLCLSPHRNTSNTILSHTEEKIDARKTFVSYSKAPYTKATLTVAFAWMFPPALLDTSPHRRLAGTKR